MSNLANREQDSSESSIRIVEPTTFPLCEGVLMVEGLTF
jgi:hypothetical protein